MDEGHQRRKTAVCKILVVFCIVRFQFERGIYNEISDLFPFESHLADQDIYVVLHACLAHLRIRCIGLGLHKIDIVGDGSQFLQENDFLKSQRRSYAIGNKEDGIRFRGVLIRYLLVFFEQASQSRSIDNNDAGPQQGGRHAYFDKIYLEAVVGISVLRSVGVEFFLVNDLLRFAALSGEEDTVAFFLAVAYFENCRGSDIRIDRNKVFNAKKSVDKGRLALFYFSHDDNAEQTCPPEFEIVQKPLIGR